MMLASALVLWLAADDGFGGAPSASAGAPAPAGECVIRTDDGRWVPCAEAVAEKEHERAAQQEARVAESAVAEAPPLPPPPEEPPPRKVSEAETTLLKAGVDVKLPIIALRIRIAEIEEEIELLTQRGYGVGRRTDLEAELATLKVISADVEYLALGRMLACMRKFGMDKPIKRIEMTPAGPVYLGIRELVAQLPAADPYPCGRIFLVEQADIDKVRHAHDVCRLVKKNPFGYRQLDDRRAAEKELADLEKWFADEGIPPMKNRIAR
jgi:hypothetical protein